MIVSVLKMFINTSQGKGLGNELRKFIAKDFDKEKKRNYVIYLLKCGKARYVGSTKNFDRRLSQHLNDLTSGKHVNDELQRNFNLTGFISYDIISQGRTHFRQKVLKVEQRMINRYANCSEITAYKNYHYDLREFLFDVIDWGFK